MKINYRFYKYAPETFEAFVDNQLLELEHDTRTTLGYWAACGRKKDVHDEIKRIVRARRKKPVRYTYGFFKEGSSSSAVFIKGNIAIANSLHSRLMCYKCAKQAVIERNGLYTECTSAELGADFKIENIRTVERKIDLSRPVRLEV